MFHYHMNDVSHISERYSSQASGIHDYKTGTSDLLHAKHIKQTQVRL